VQIIYDYQIFGAQSFGGISRYFCSLARESDVLPDTSVKIIAPVYRSAHLRALSQRLVTGQYMPPLPKTERVTRFANGRLFPFLARRFRPDVVHETYYSAQATYPGDVGRVLTVFDMIDERFPEHSRERELVVAAKASAISRADRIICISQHTRDDLRQFHSLPADSVRVVHLGFDRLDAHGLPASNFIGDRPYLLFVGARNGYKNFMRLAAAYAASTALRRAVRVVCLGGGAFTPDERCAFRSLGLADDDVVAVQGGDDVLAALYSDARVLVYPSIYEGFGIPTLEAMSLGCPVACSASSSLPEVVGAAAELFDPQDLDSIRSGVESVVLSDDRRDELVRRGLARASQFSWERCARETDAVYRELGTADS
jgi:glycosyltransferase involved in cell wall biosynthesis